MLLSFFKRFKWSLESPFAQRSDVVSGHSVNAISSEVNAQKLVTQVQTGSEEDALFGAHAALRDIQVLNCPMHCDDSGEKQHSRGV